MIVTFASMEQCMVGYQTRSLSGPQAKTLKMEAACSNEASLKLHTSTRCNKVHNILTLSMCRRENFELKN